MLWLISAAVVALALVVWRINARIARNLPRPNETAPGFSLADQNGNTRTLEAFRGKWLVLYFYPRDDTPGCAEQAMRFRDAMRELEALGAAVCGVSVDNSASHAAFARKYKLPFALLADRAGEVAARYGSLLSAGFIKFARRNTFLIDPEGRIARVYVGVNAGRNAGQVGEDLKALTKEAGYGSATQG
jgi:thioredoxin-dependent peroxiredoxin